MKNSRRSLLLTMPRKLGLFFRIPTRGIKAVKNSKLQRLTTSFEEIRMDEDESFDEFYAKFKDIVNSAFNLGERIPKHKILGRSSDLFQRDSMPRSLPSKNQRILTLFL